MKVWKELSDSHISFQVRHCSFNCCISGILLYRRCRKIQLFRHSKIKDKNLWLTLTFLMVCTANLSGSFKYHIISPNFISCCCYEKCLSPETFKQKLHVHLPGTTERILALPQWLNEMRAPQSLTLIACFLCSLNFNLWIFSSNSNSVLNHTFHGLII